MIRHICAALFLVLAVIAPAPAQDSGEQGVTYREVRRFEKSPVTTTHLEERTETVLRTETVTEFHAQQRTVWVPTTEYRYQPRWPSWLNPLAHPANAYELRPVTRWEPRTESVQVPITRQKIIPETKIVRVPVRTLGFAQREVVEQIAVHEPSAPARTLAPAVVANQPQRVPVSNLGPRGPGSPSVHEDATRR